jgi:hypothetical protein
MKRLLAYAGAIATCVFLYWLWLALIGRGGLIARETHWAAFENLTNWRTYVTICLTYLALALVVPGSDQPSRRSRYRMSVPISAFGSY